ncbi:MAG: hypothetical protein ACYDG4_13135 [Desulfuromonadaceae bacterium]
MLEIINKFTLNLAKPYVKFTFKIIFDPSEIALRIKRSQHLELSPFEYVRQGVVCIIGIWLLGYLVTSRISSAPSLVFSIIIGIYFIVKIVLFAIILWVLNVGNKPISFSLKAYSYIVGAFAPIAIVIIELISIYYDYFYNISDIHNAENIVMIIFGIIGIGYLYRFLKIIQEVGIVRYIIAVVVYSIFATVAIDHLFIKLVDLIRIKGLL